MTGTYYIITEELHTLLQDRRVGDVVFEDAWVNPHGWICAKWLDQFFPELVGRDTVVLTVNDINNNSIQK